MYTVLYGLLYYIISSLCQLVPPVKTLQQFIVLNVWDGWLRCVNPTYLVVDKLFTTGCLPLISGGTTEETELLPEEMLEQVLFSVVICLRKRLILLCKQSIVVLGMANTKYI